MKLQVTLSFSSKGLYIDWHNCQSRHVVCHNINFFFCTGRMSSIILWFISILSFVHFIHQGPYSFHCIKLQEKKFFSIVDLFCEWSELAHSAYDFFMPHIWMTVQTHKVHGDFPVIFNFVLKESIIYTRGHGQRRLSR